jgi:hypothetical protein
MEQVAHESVISALDRAPLVILPLIREVPKPLRKRRPSVGKWSAHEHACHIAAVHPMASERLRLMLEHNHPTIRPYVPEREHSPDALLSVDLEEALGRFKAERAGLVSRLRELRAADWDRTAEHPEYSRYSVFILFRHLVMHDMHTRGVPNGAGDARAAEQGDEADEA